jgi:glycosyltransferase involved in cell wall biosynthesis
MEEKNLTKISFLHDGGPISGISTYFYNLYRNVKNHHNETKLYQYLRWEPEIELPLGTFVVHGSRTKIKHNKRTLQKIDNAITLFSGSNWKNFLKVVGDEPIILSNPSLLELTKYHKKTIAMAHDLYYLHKNNDSKILNYYFAKKYPLFKNASFILSNSEFTKSELMKFLDIEESKVDVVYPTFNQDIFKPTETIYKESVSPKLNNVKKILSVGWDNPHKNISVIIKALNLLPSNYELLRVYSNIGISDSNLKLIKENNLNKRIHLYPNLKTEELGNLYREADVFVFPSLFEGFGIPLIEAMASGTPVITSNRGSLPEVVGDAGFICDPFDVDFITNAITELTEENKIREEYIRKGLKRSQLFTPKAQFESLIKVPGIK